MYVLGISFGHGSAATLTKDGEVIAAVEEEKLNRKKGFVGFPSQAVDFVLGNASLQPENVDYVAIGCANIAEWAYNYRRLATIFNKRGFGPRVIELLLYALKIFFPDIRYASIYFKYFYKQMESLGFVRERIVLVNHHLAHAASAYFVLPWRDAVVITSDGKGDGISSAVYHGKNFNVQEVDQQSDLVSIGQLYQSVTKYLGYKVNRHEGKITGLSAYGDAQSCTNHFNEILQYNDNGSFVNLFQENEELKRNPLSFLKRRVRPKTWRTVRYVRSLEGNLRRFAVNYQMYLNFLREKMGADKPENIAAGVQEISEQLIVSYCSHYITKKGFPVNICLAGGLFANVKINQRIREISGVNNLYVHQAMDDAGTSLGASLWTWVQKRGNDNSWPRMKTVYLGPSYSEDDMESGLQEADLPYKRVQNIEEVIAGLIDAGKIVGRFNGSMEWGPRALGNRSILASAKDSSINDILNDRLQRTEFMPFAPSVIDEDAPKFFKGYASTDEGARYMTVTYDVEEEGCSLFPAVVHVDKTSRPQVVFREQNESYYRILHEYKKLTGFGVIVNTSFNMHEEPIVNTPQDAVRAYLANAVDVLAIGPFLVERRP